MTKIINQFVMKNLIYCEDCHSFVHMLWMKWKKKFPESNRDAQHSAWDTIEDMNKQENFINSQSNKYVKK